MDTGTKVSFSWETSPGKVTSGTGEVISAKDKFGRVLVAVAPEAPEARHFVILCTVTWLTALDP